jgi:hypothetical protein
MKKVKRFLQQGISSVWAIMAIVVVSTIFATAFLVYGYFWQPEILQQFVSKKIIHINEEYGFELTLPVSWKGYSVLNQTWTGYLINEYSNSKTENGPEIVIRNPNWKENNIWQDIPIMIFTPDEWTLIQDENMAVSAAPIGPQELGRNSKYIFALPPRWVGFYDALGQDEAQSIVKTFTVIAR